MILKTTALYLSEAWRKKSIGRTSMNLHIKEHLFLTGKTLDLGGGSSPSYYRFLGHVGPPPGVIHLDIFTNHYPDLVGSLESDLPFQDSYFDTVLLFNVLEHIYQFKRLLSEIFRILEPGGEIHVWVPFHAPIHPDPEDFHRYSASALARLFAETGFLSNDITGYSGLGLVLADLVRPLMRNRLLNTGLTMIALSVDAIFSWIAPKMNTRYILGYYAVAQK